MARALREAIKEMIEALGLPPIRYGGKSCRSGFATHMAACGVGKEELYEREGVGL